MPKIEYVDVKLSASRLAVVQHANEIIDEYARMHCHGWHVGRLPRAAARRQLSFEQRTPVLVKGQGIPPKVEG